MYYLNDKHPKYEYAIYTRVNNACPYISKVFTNYRQVEEFIKAIENRHNRLHHLFYIEAEQYKNIYPKEIAIFYYKVLKRPVNDWQEIA